MMSNAQIRTSELAERLADEGVDYAVISDRISIRYFGDFWNFAGTEVGRPTIMVVARDGECALITPRIEAEMARAMTWISRIHEYVDGEGREWRGPLEDFAMRRRARCVASEVARGSTDVERFVRNMQSGGKQHVDLTPFVDSMRMIKSDKEIQILRQAGEVAVAMNDAALSALDIGISEYELALAVNTAGTRKAAELLRNGDVSEFHSPNICNLQILQSGPQTCMVHRRPTLRCVEAGDPIYLCYCTICDFQGFMLGFDRTYFVRSITDEQARDYETMLKAQAAALGAVYPGAIAEDVHAAAAEVYKEVGLSANLRTGRAIGYQPVEKPEMKPGDKTILQPGMTFCIDGAISVRGKYGCGIGDSIVVTERGFEYLAPYPRELSIV